MKKKKKRKRATFLQSEHKTTTQNKIIEEVKVINIIQRGNKTKDDNKKFHIFLLFLSFLFICIFYIFVVFCLFTYYVTLFRDTRALSYFINKIMLITLCSFCTSLPFTSKNGARRSSFSCFIAVGNKARKNIHVICIITHYVTPLFFTAN